MSNAELKLKKEVLAEEYTSVKSKIINLCKKLEVLENEYSKINNELDMRKNILN